jgi:hypothetical protein
MVSREILNKNVLFPGSSQILIEYHDTLGTPQMNLLHLLSSTPTVYHEMFDFSELSKFDITTKLLWYICRKHQNFLIDINKIKLSDDDCDKILIDLLNKNESLYRASFGPLMQLLGNIVSSKACDDIVIWSKNKESHISDSLQGVFKNLKFRYAYGPFSRQVAKAPEYTSFLVTDHRNIQNIVENRKKGFHIFSVAPLGYNKDEELNKKLDLDIKKLGINYKKISIMKGLPVWLDHLNNLKLEIPEDTK